MYLDMESKTKQMPGGVGAMMSCYVHKSPWMHAGGRTEETTCDPGMVFIVTRKDLIVAIAH